jgi:hypothetical protein
MALPAGGGRGVGGAEAQLSVGACVAMGHSDSHLGRVVSARMGWWSSAEWNDRGPTTGGSVGAVLLGEPRSLVGDVRVPIGGERSMALLWRLCGRMATKIENPRQDMSCVIHK